MHHIAFLAVCYLLGSRYHSGQWSKGYQLLCLADQRSRREHSALNIGRVVEHLDNNTLYPKDGTFRNMVAYYLHKMRKHRFDL